MRIELTTETLQVFLAEALEHASPLKNETVFRDFTDGLFPITCCVATQSRVPKQSTLGHSNSR